VPLRHRRRRQEHKKTRERLTLELSKAHEFDLVVVIDSQSSARVVAVVTV
jgi:hypothetical protein